MAVWECCWCILKFKKKISKMFVENFLFTFLIFWRFSYYIINFHALNKIRTLMENHPKFHFGEESVVCQFLHEILSCTKIIFISLQNFPKNWQFYFDYALKNHKNKINTSLHFVNLYLFVEICNKICALRIYKKNNFSEKWCVMCKKIV